MCFVTVGVAASRAGQTETEAKFVWCFVFSFPDSGVRLYYYGYGHKVGQTDTKTRYVLYFAVVTCCV